MNKTLTVFILIIGSLLLISGCSTTNQDLDVQPNTENTQEETPEENNEQQTQENNDLVPPALPED